VDTAPYKKIGYETAVDNRRWAGPVIATPDALYCALLISNSRGDLLARGMGGALGGAIGGLIVHGIMKSTATAPPVDGTIADVPEFLRAPGTGPWRKFKPAQRVLIIPRKAISEIVKNSWINNTLLIRLGHQRVIISHNVFSPGGVREYLAATGWPMVWRGKAYNDAGTY